MPRIVKWEEKLKYVRPEHSIDFNFLTPKAQQQLIKSKNLEKTIDEICCEAWWCHHLSGYESDFIDKTKEVPKVWEI